MGDLASEDDLVLEPLGDGLISRQVLPDNLEGNFTIDLTIPSLVDPPHPALAEHTQYLIAAAQHVAYTEGSLFRAGWSLPGDGLVRDLGIVGLRYGQSTLGTLVTIVGYLATTFRTLLHWPPGRDCHQTQD